VDVTWFLLKGLLRDRSRSLFPVLVVTAGVMLTVFMQAWVSGENYEFVRASAAFQTGHVKVMTRAYAEKSDEMPNDLAIEGVGQMLTELRKEFPQMVWTPRIKFGGLLDVPDSLGETMAQGPVAGMAVDLFSDSSPESKLLNLKQALARGRMPRAPGEIIVSDDLARKLDVGPGSTVTLFGSTMYGSMATANFTIAGTVRFGITALDKGAVIADVADIQAALAMDDAAGEVVGFFRDGEYKDRQAQQVTKEFNARLAGTDDQFAPVMAALPDQGELRQVLQLHGFSLGIVITVFLVAMSLVLWNAGLMGSLRRYGEFGVRLAIGEGKPHLYRTLVAESVMVGVIGSALGTLVGLGTSYWFQAHGLNFGALMKGSTVMYSSVIRPHVSATCWFVGLIPGLGATIVGSMISGATVFRRQTATLIKELEL
jgi:putative ABC transport system permease protein